MPDIHLPENLCRSLHPHYAGATSDSEVTRFIRNAAKAMVESAVADGIPAAIKPHGGDGLTVRVMFSAAADAILTEISRRDGISEAEAAERYLAAAMARGDALSHQLDTGNDAFEAYLKADGKEPRHAQVTFFNCLTDSLSTGKIGLVEGATGIGKTLAMVAAAAELLASKVRGRVVITTPSLQILRQFVLTHRRLAVSLPDMAECRVTVGRQEFVNTRALRQVIEDGIVPIDDNGAPILAWLADGGEPCGLGEAFALPYLCSSLLDVSPNFPVELVRLTDQAPGDDPGAVAYAEQFLHADADGDPAREIVYCTHAMVAVDLRRRMAAARRVRNEESGEAPNTAMIRALTGQRNAAEDKSEVKRLNRDIRALILEDQARLAHASVDDGGHLPPWQHLLVDEAHLFEMNLGSALSSYISVQNLVADIRQLHAAGILSANAVTRAQAAAAELRKCAPDSDQDLDLARADSPAAQRAREALADLSKSINGARTKSGSAPNPLLERTRRAAGEIHRSLSANAGGGMISLVRYSPIRHYPQVFVGRKNITPELTFLWDTTDSAACVSATLYLRRNEVDSAAYFRLILGIPESRAIEYPPIRPSWVTHPVVELRVPEPVSQPGKGRHWLQPPSRADNLDLAGHQAREKAWLNEVADEVIRIHQSAAGGVLVLMTSYATIGILSGRLAALDPSCRLVLADPDHALSARRAEFIELARAGERPLWLALGAAWVGLDINGNDLDPPLPASEDNLMTDLVIPRIPFSLNRSMTHHHRTTMRNSVPWELLDTAMRFKQGIGRLVRREGLPANRRIHVLDGRINDPRFENYFSLLNRIMGIYPVRRFER